MKTIHFFDVIKESIIPLLNKVIKWDFNNYEVYINVFHTCIVIEKHINDNEYIKLKLFSDEYIIYQYDNKAGILEEIYSYFTNENQPNNDIEFLHNILNLTELKKYQYFKNLEQKIEKRDNKQIDKEDEMDKIKKELQKK